MQLVVGLATSVTVVGVFSPALQGYYYLFLSLLALQTFFELGLGIVLFNFAAHEWAHLSLTSDGRVTGSARSLARLATLYRLSLRWFALCALSFFVIVSVVGILLMSNVVVGLEWRGPWITAVFCVSGTIFLLPTISVLEGCGQMAATYWLRLLQSLVSFLFFTGSALAGWGLWSVAVGSLGSLLATVFFLRIFHRNFLLSLRSELCSHDFSWRTEVLPLQLRLGLQSLAAYFVYSSFTPILFHFRGAEEAGRLGLSMQVVNAIQSFSLIFITTKTPRFAHLAVAKMYMDLERQRARAARYSLIAMSTGVVMTVCVIALLDILEVRIVGRLVDASLFSLIGLGALFNVWGQSYSAAFRALKQDPLTVTACITGVAMILSVVSMTYLFGVTGLTLAYLTVNIFIMYPVIYAIWRKKITALLSSAM